MHRWPWYASRSPDAEVLAESVRSRHPAPSYDGSNYEETDPLAWTPLVLVPKVVAPCSGKRKLGLIIANCKVVHSVCNVPWQRCYEASEEAKSMYEATMLLLKKHLAETEELQLLVPLLQHRINGNRKHCMPAEQEMWDRAHALLRGKKPVDWPKEMCATELLLFSCVDRRS